MKNIIISLFIFASFLFVSCENKEAIQRYEQEKHILEIMKIEHQRELDRAIATGSSQPAIAIMKIEHAQKEMEQANLVYELAKEAGLE